MLTPEQLERIVAALRTLYAGAERTLLALVADWVRTETRNPGSGPGTYAQHAQIRAILDRLLAQARTAAREALARSATDGRRAAERDLPPAHLRAATPLFPRTPAQTLVHAPAGLMPSLSRMYPQLMASTDGMYREVMREVISMRLGGTAGRLRLAQQVLDRAAAQGITGYVSPKSGRRWNLVSYVEMCTRTAARVAANDGYAALCVEHGYDLVRVTTVANCSDLCAPFQGRLLSITGRPTSVPVVATLAEARARGFEHPNCRHALRLWTPDEGPPPEPEPVDPAGYRATQKLRRLERGIRAQKRVRAAALDRTARQAADARIRALQKQVRDHVADTGIPRIRRREQIGVPL